MSLTDREKTLVSNSFNQVAPIADQVAEIFYNHLFEIAPETKPLFAKADMTEQGRKLMQMITVAVKSLDQLETIIPAVQALGQRHVTYGVTKDQYAIVGQVLIWTLEAGLKEDFTDEVREAWVKVYTLLAGVATQAYDVQV